jgi:hypothetical protein
MKFLFRLLYPPPEQRPPTLLGIGLTVQFLVASVSLPRDIETFSVVRLGWFALQMLVITATALMSRWGVLAFAALTLLGVATALTRFPLGIGTGGILFGISMRAAVLLPGFLFWDRMSWSYDFEALRSMKAHPPPSAPPPEPASAPRTSAAPRAGVARLACADCGTLSCVEELVRLRGRSYCAECARYLAPDASSQ